MSLHARAGFARRAVDNALSNAIRRLPRLNDPPVLVYHEVGAPLPRAAAAMTISPSRFERHVHWLAELGYTGIAASQWFSIYSGKSDGPPKPVLITFDDGYAGVGRHALPTLLEYGFTATVFVVTARLGGTNDWDAHVAHEGHQLMTADDILSWSAAGIEIGAHSRSHPNLTTLSDSDALFEIEGSHSDLADLLDFPPTCFAYPYGFSDEASRKMVAEFFTTAFAVTESPNRPSTDIYSLNRSGALPEDSRADLLLRLHVGWTPRHQVAMRARRRVGRLRRRLDLV